MPLKTSFYYSPNFNSKKRLPKKIRFIIFHYTGMKTESSALKKLTDEKSKVSSHYLIKKMVKFLHLFQIYMLPGMPEYLLGTILTL